MSVMLRHARYLLILTVATFICLIFLFMAWEEKLAGPRTHGRLSSPSDSQEIVTQLQCEIVYPRRNTILVGDDSKKFLLFIYSPHCPVCENSWPMWEKIVAYPSTHPTSRFVALSIISERAKFPHSKGAFPAGLEIGLWPLNRKSAEYQISTVPVTLLLVGRHLVKRWVGSLGERDADEIRAALRQADF